MDSIETILKDTQNAAFCGLHNSRTFSVDEEKGEPFHLFLEQLGIRHLAFSGERSFRIICFTTGIRTDKPFDIRQE